MKYFKKLLGERVYLSPMNPEDAETYAKWLNDLSVTENLGMSGAAISVAGEQEWIRKNAQGLQFAIVKSENDALIGTCGFNAVDQARQCAELGIFIGSEDDRGCGYGAEALSLLAGFGFDYLNLNNIMLKVFAFNTRAIRCYRKVGFREIGRRRQAYYLKGEYHDDVFMDLIRSEFYANR
jgi:RimJ/RimL family protein N-acetyltransferase